MSSAYPGEFEQIVLLAVLRWGEKVYGVPIRAEIENRASRKVTVGALYATPVEGCIRPHVGGPPCLSRRNSPNRSCAAW